MRKQKQKHNRIWTPIYKYYQKVRDEYGIPKPFALTIDSVFPTIGICLADYTPVFKKSKQNERKAV